MPLYLSNFYNVFISHETNYEINRKEITPTNGRNNDSDGPGTIKL